MATSKVFLVIPYASSMGVNVLRRYVIALHRMCAHHTSIFLMFAGLTLFVPVQDGFAAGKLLFKSNYAPGTSTANVYNTPDRESGLIGIDTETGFNWGDWSNNPLIESTNFQYVALEPYQDWVTTEVLPEFQGRTNVLMMEVKGNAPRSSRTRNEMMFRPQSSARDDFKIYVRYWMFLPSDYVENIDLNEEYHNVILGPKHKKLPGATNYNGSYNYTIMITQDGAKPIWRLKRQYQDLETGDTIREGLTTNSDVPVPLGKWFLVEQYYKKHATSGRIWFAINGEVVFDYNGRTQHPTDPTGVDFYSAMKSYRGKGHKFPFAQYYDDIEIWSDFPDSQSVPVSAETSPTVPTAVSVEIIN